MREVDAGLRTGGPLLTSEVLATSDEGTSTAAGWRMFWRTNRKSPANQEFLGGLENR